MRIIGGYLKGSRLYAPNGTDIRPTADRVKESVFNILGSIKDFKILDLYAGTGNLAFESLSRDAGEAVLIDCSKNAADVIRKNAGKLDVSDKIKVINAPVLPALSTLMGRQFDIIFADPPYNKDPSEIVEVIGKIRDLSLLSKEGIMVLEFSARKKMEQKFFRVEDMRKYGDTEVYFLR